MPEFPQTPQESSAEGALRIAKEDLLRRVATQSPDSPGLDLVIAALDKIESDQLRETQDAAFWDAEYQFWNRIISEEAERFRFNEGFEPLKFDLYPNLGKKKRSEHDFLGITQVGRRKFRVVARNTFDADGAAVIRVEVTAKQPTKAEEAARWAMSSKRLYNEK